MAAPLTQQHQIFLQAMMANRVMRYDDARRMHHEIVTTVVEPGADRTSVSEIGKSKSTFRLGDDASAIFAVDPEIGTSILLTNMVLSGCGRRLSLRVPPWPRRRDASVGREAAAATARRRCSP